MLLSSILNDTGFSMVFTKLLLENTLPVRPFNYEAASEPYFPILAGCIPVLSSGSIGKCAARVLCSVVTPSSERTLQHELKMSPKRESLFDCLTLTWGSSHSGVKLK